MSVSPVLAALSETEFQDMIVKRAKAQGWLVHHDRRQDLDIAGDPGFPDLTLARNGIVLFIEVKTMDGIVTPSQEKWFDELWGHGTANAIEYVALIARPSDWRDLQTLIDTKGKTT